MNHIGKEVEFQARGRTWRLCRWDRDIWDEFLTWAKTQLPDVLGAVENRLVGLALRQQAVQEKLNDRYLIAGAAAPAGMPMGLTPGLPPLPGTLGDDPETKRLQQEVVALQGLQDRIIQGALTLAAEPVIIGAPRVAQLLRSPEGGMQLAWCMLRRHQPDVTRNDALEIFLELGPDRMQEYFDRAAGTSGAAPGNGPRPPAA